MENDKIRILVIDDEQDILDVFEENLTLIGYAVTCCRNGREALDHFRTHSADVVITDIKLPDTSGIEVVRKIMDLNKKTIVLVITGYASVKSSVDALRMGALDYFPKPVNIKHLDIVIKRAVENLGLSGSLPGHSESNTKRDRFCKMIGGSLKMNEAYRHIQTISRTDFTVLIQGETGTGKELAAEAVHNLSRRKDYPFIKVNCASLPESLLESELFGHMEGAFTGARKYKKGLFEAAQHGTILLDEIEAASRHTQASLLRVCENKEIVPVGGNAPVKLDVRIIAVSNKNLESLVSGNEFREDLFFRLIESVITLPPLRERVEDIPTLIEHFATRFSNKRSYSFSPRAVEVLKKHDWPGNVRELRHMITRVLSMSTRTIIRPADLPEQIREKKDTPRGLKTLREQERELLIEALKRTSWNKLEAAKILGVARKTIYSLIKKHKVTIPE